MEHTPGPWHTEEGSYGHYVKVVDPTGRTVARIPWGGNDGGNAELIAAAPELLAALEAALPMIDGYREGSASVCEAARAALAKARG